MSDETPQEKKTQGKLALGLLFLTVGVCLAAADKEATPFPADWPHRVPFHLERELILPGTERILFIVEVIDGAPPKEEGLDHLAETAARNGGVKAFWVRGDDPGAPAFRWKPSKVKTPSELYRQILDCPDGPLRAETTYVFVRYQGDSRSAYGRYMRTESTQSCGGRSFPVIYLAQQKIARDRVPVISQAFLEKRALVHEYGHALGLATNPAHGRRASYGYGTGTGAHCTNTECAVAVPTPMALLRGRMLDYCEDCRRDIEQAREHWLTGKSFPEVPRKPRADPGAHVARLKKYNFTPGGEAEKLLVYGKSVMPALVERMQTLPGGRYGSPRYTAVLLAKKIIVAEDRKRRGIEPSRRYPDLSGGGAEGLFLWWAAEGPAFMQGDGWRLPDSVASAVDKAN